MLNIEVLDKGHIQIAITSVLEQLERFLWTKISRMMYSIRKMIFDADLKLIFFHQMSYCPPTVEGMVVENLV